MNNMFNVKKRDTDPFTKRHLFKCDCKSEKDAEYAMASLLLIVRDAPYFAELYTDGATLILDVPPNCKNIQELIHCLNKKIESMKKACKHRIIPYLQAFIYFMICCYLN